MRRAACLRASHCMCAVAAQSSPSCAPLCGAVQCDAMHLWCAGLGTCIASLRLGGYAGWLGRASVEEF
jgi:hypothetical protein